MLVKSFRWASAVVRLFAAAMETGAPGVQEEEMQAIAKGRSSEDEGSAGGLGFSV